MAKKVPFLIFILGALTAVSPFSIDLYLPAFRQISEQLNTTPERVAFTLSSYFIGLALGQLFYGPFLDRFGRKPPLLWGLGLYILASAACFFSNSIDSLIAFRLLQALGGCAAQVASMAMVRDFYPPQEGARVFSKLMLLLSVSPLFAPTVGALIVTVFGWRAVFFFLSAVVLLITLVVHFFLPEGHEADPSISLNPKSILRDQISILKDHQFFSYAFAGAFSFSGLFGYLGGASPLFMGTFGVNANTFGMIFAGLSVGVIGGGQVNIFLTHHFSSERIFRTALYTQTLIALFFVLGSCLNWFNLVSTLSILFLFLSCVGLTLPNATSLALAPFERNAGTAAALLGFLQMGTGALASAGFGFLPFSPLISISLLLAIGSVIGTFILKSRPLRPAL